MPQSHLDIAKVGRLHFEKPDFNKFKSLLLAYQVLDAGGTAPCVLNAANEEAVSAFLDKRMTLDNIVDLVREVLNMHKIIKNPKLDEILSADKRAREEANKLIAAESVR
jgi:1-deoxy-D-xylulose-5-phosphate reductoisomerase